MLLSSLNLILSEAEKRNWLNNHEFASLVLRSLSNINEFNEIIQAALSWIMEKYKEFTKNRDYEKAIDCLYGLDVKKTDLELEENVLQEIIQHIDGISDETLAKLCIIFKNKKFAIIFIRELERRLEEEFKNSLSPSLERGLREIISLMNSTYPQEAIKSIIDAKVKEGKTWAGHISVENKGISIKQIPELGELPRINPKFHALAFKALDIHNRSSAIMLNKDEFLRMKEVFNASKKGYLGVRRKEYQIILLMTSITSFFTFIFFPEIVLKILALDYRTVIALIQELVQDPIKIVIKVIIECWIPGISIWLWIWLVRILYFLRKGGEVSILELFKFMPLLGYLVKKLLSAEDGD
jgi:hypothetical protein